MTSIPSNLGRVSAMLSRNIMLGSLSRTQQDLLNLNVKLSTGLDVNRPSDNAVAASAISVFDDIIERREQRLRNLSHAESVLNNVDAALSDASGLLLEAKGIASSQIGPGSNTQTRANQATVIDALLDEMYSIANRQYQDLYFFGGTATANPPMIEALGQVRYQGAGDGLVTDLGFIQSMPITLGAEEAFGSLSARVRGSRDLNPGLTTDTRLADLNGATGMGIRLGSINADINGTSDITIDLTVAHTIGDAAAIIEQTIQAELDANFAGQTISVGIDAATNSRLEITLSGGATVTITDLAAGGTTVEATAADLGLVQTFPAGAATTGGDLDPRITPLTDLSTLAGITTPLGTIRLTNAGITRDLDLSGATTIQDVQNAVAGLNLGIRVDIADTGDRLNFFNELSGGIMSIGEVGGGSTATELGIRSFSADTRLEDFNDGLGVEIISGSVDPVSGLPDPGADLDFRVTLSDGRDFDVDLAGAETVGDVLAAINAAAAAAAPPVAVPGEFEAALAADGNGIELTDGTGGGGTMAVTRLNGSFAAENLGILGSAAGATLTGEDRATVAVDGVFGHLIALRDALLADDERGITLAGEKLDEDITRLAAARADVGVRTRRVTDGVDRQEDLQVQDQSLRSELRDLEYTEALTRFASLQQQLQAALQSTANIQSLSLLDFLR